MKEKMKDPMKEWLSEYSNEGTRRVSKRRFEQFLEFTGKTAEQLVDEFEQKKARHLILQFQNHMLNVLKLSKHTVKSTIGSVRGFYASQCQPIFGLRGKLVKAKRPSQKEHQFSTNDLRKMYHVANTRDKAILCIGTMGWEVSAVREMERDYFEKLVKRARSESLEFISEWTERQKEDEMRLMILNPCMLDALERWLEKTKDSKSEYLWANGRGKKPITSDTFNDILRSLAEEADIVTTGKIHWHLLRKWIMVTLSNAGFGEFETKLIVGKAIPSSDMTYLEGLRATIIPKYKQAYPQHLSLVGYSNHKTKIETVEQALDIAFQVIKEIAKKEGITLDSLGRSLTPEQLAILKMRLGIKEKEPKEDA